MKLTYVIDGYNLLHAMGILLGKKIGGHGLEKARNKLLADLAESFGSEASLITVVFDAAVTPRRAQAEQEIQGIRVLFSQGGQEADDLIEGLISRHPHPKFLAVVSDDHRLQRAARRREAHDMSCSDFLDIFEKRQPEKNAQLQAPLLEEAKQTLLSPAETQHWLAEFGHLQKELDRHDLPVKLEKLPPARPGKQGKPTEKP